MTDVDGAEKDPRVAFSVNTEGAVNISKVAKGLGACFTHISTDYVFDGSAVQPYRETDTCAPPNAYGRTKWEAEKKILHVFPQACIVRTSWLFGVKGKNFISLLIQWLMQKEEIQAVYDQHGKPTYCYDLAEAVLVLLGKEGIWHFANEGDMTRYQIALHLLETAKESGYPVKCQRIIPVPSAQFPTLAMRPPYSVLDTSKYVDFTHHKPRHWIDAAREFLKDAL
jgi:dTDP-4-dehydrorhamnose reductase